MPATQTPAINIDRVLAFTGAAVSVALFLVPRTVVTVSLFLVVIFLLLLNPAIAMGRLVHIGSFHPRGWVSIAVLLGFVSVLGAYSWPTPTTSLSAPEIAEEVIRHLPTPIPPIQLPLPNPMSSPSKAIADGRRPHLTMNDARFRTDGPPDTRFLWRFETKNDGQHIAIRPIARLVWLSKEQPTPAIRDFSTPNEIAANGGAFGLSLWLSTEAIDPMRDVAVHFMVLTVVYIDAVTHARYQQSWYLVWRGMKQGETLSTIESMTNEEKDWFLSVVPGSELLPVPRGHAIGDKVSSVAPLR